MKGYYLATGYDRLGLAVWHRIVEAEEDTAIALVELKLYECAELNSIELDHLDFGPRGTLAINRCHETRVPF